MDFAYTPKVLALRERLDAFMQEHVYSNERRYADDVAANTAAGKRWTPTRIVEELKPKARAAGCGTSSCRNREHGAGLTNLEYAPLCRSDGPRALGLRGLQLLGARHRQHGDVARYGTPEQKQQWLQAAARRRDPLGVRDDRAGGGLVGCDQHRDAHRARRR